MTNGTSAYEPLSKLFRGDLERVRRTLDVFARVNQADLALMDEAHARGDWTEIARLMHKMKSACLQIGEQAAAEAAVALERELSDTKARPHRYAVARAELGQVQDRVARYLATEN